MVRNATTVRASSRTPFAAEVRTFLLAFDANSVVRYYVRMIKGFRDKDTEKLWRGRKSKVVPPHLREKAFAKLLSVDIATSLDELRAPPSNQLHKLGGNRQGQWAIWINQQYRVCFEFEGGDAYEVEVVDYHK